ncbi:hypothetical protein, partial [Streptococcus sp. k-628]|uniref:hypothetical protein n=1 Tax=Streptococcus sp. k-628 TaxID=2582635 RepID=UPI001565C26A
MKPSSYTAGQAVSVSATKGSDATTSQASSASITPTEHTVDIASITKVKGEAVEATDLTGAVTATGKDHVEAVGTVPT